MLRWFQLVFGVDVDDDVIDGSTSISNRSESPFVFSCFFLVASYDHIISSYQLTNLIAIPGDQLKIHVTVSQPLAYQFTSTGGRANPQKWPLHP